MYVLCSIYIYTIHIMYCKLINSLYVGGLGHINFGVEFVFDL